VHSRCDEAARDGARAPVAHAVLRVAHAAAIEVLCGAIPALRVVPLRTLLRTGTGAERVPDGHKQHATAEMRSVPRLRDGHGALGLAQVRKVVDTVRARDGVRLPQPAQHSPHGVAGAQASQCKCARWQGPLNQASPLTARVQEWLCCRNSCAKDVRLLHALCYQVKLRTSVAVTWFACPAVWQVIPLPNSSSEQLAQGQYAGQAFLVLKKLACQLSRALLKLKPTHSRVMGRPEAVTALPRPRKQILVSSCWCTSSHCCAHTDLRCLQRRCACFSLQDDVQVLVEGGPALGRPHRRAVYSALGRSLCSHGSPGTFLHMLPAAASAGSLLCVCRKPGALWQLWQAAQWHRQELLLCVR